MMSLWHLLWICPLCALAGAFCLAVVIGGTDPEQPQPPAEPEPWDPDKIYGYGDRVSYQGKILRCEVPSRSYAFSWNPEIYPLAWKEEEKTI